MSEYKCNRCNDTGVIACRFRDGQYAFAGPVPDDAKGYFDADCLYCDAMLENKAVLRGQLAAKDAEIARLREALIHDKERWLEITIAYRNLHAADTANAAIREINEAVREVPYPTDGLGELGRPEKRPFWGDDPSGHCNGDLDVAVRLPASATWGEIIDEAIKAPNGLSTRATRPKAKDTQQSQKFTEGHVTEKDVPVGKNREADIADAIAALKRKGTPNAK